MVDSDIFAILFIEGGDFSQNFHIGEYEDGEGCYFVQHIVIYEIIRMLKNQKIKNSKECNMKK